VAGNKKRVLITGCEGFIGSYLAELLVAQNLDVHGMVFQDTKLLDHFIDKIHIFNGSITDKDRVTTIINEAKPDFIFHLAAQSLIINSWLNPELTFTVNALGTLHLLEAVSTAGIDPTIVLVCSSDEYESQNGHQTPILESAPVGPSSPYGVSKLAADMLGRIYWQNYGTRIIRIRPFSIIGPGKTGDACSDFARGIVEIESGKITKLSVGNIDVVRDFVDVRDAVDAMWLLAEKGKPGHAFNICSGKGTSIKDILDKLASMSSHQIDIEQSPERMRQSDKPYLVGDCSKLKAMGWKPQIPLDKTLQDILNYWRSCRHSEGACD
jgi:GDP-4-dehydro-6-deoxy-D-mannose reductase